MAARAVLGACAASVLSMKAQTAASPELPVHPGGKGHRRAPTSVPVGPAKLNHTLPALSLTVPECQVARRGRATARGR